MKKSKKGKDEPGSAVKASFFFSKGSGGGGEIGGDVGLARPLHHFIMHTNTDESHSHFVIQNQFLNLPSSLQYSLNLFILIHLI